MPLQERGIEMNTYETINLHNVDGISCLSGTDDNGCIWTQFEVDYFADQEDGECDICGEVLSEGWMCLDGGDEVCDSHVNIVNRL